MSLPALSIPRVRSELACGALLVVSPRPSAPVTAVRVHVRGGSALDPPGHEGLAALVGRLVDQGTRAHDEHALSTLLEPAGGEIHGDATGFLATIAGASTKLLLELVCELLTSASYPSREVERQKRRLASRLQIEEADPRTQAARAFRRLVYGRHWLGRPSQGWARTVRACSAADLRRYHARHWRGRRVVVAVCGDVDPAEVKRIFERGLADWTRGEAWQPPPGRMPARAVRVAAHRASRQQVHVYLGHLGIRRAHPDYAALTVMDHVLGTGPGFTNRISRRLRDELGLAYTVHADVHSSAGTLPGTFTAYIGTSPEHVATAVGGFLAEIRRIQEERVGDEELATARNYLLGAYALGFERAARRASYLVAAERYGFPDDHLENLLAEFAAVSAEDVQRVARAHLFPDACCLAASGPTSKAELLEALRSAPGPQVAAHRLSLPTHEPPKRSRT